MATLAVVLLSGLYRPQWLRRPAASVCPKGNTWLARSHCPMERRDSAAKVRLNDWNDAFTALWKVSTKAPTE